MLNKKLFRDIKNNKSQFVTIFLMVFLGVLVYSGVRSYMDGMQITANKFYKNNNLQDLNVLSNNISQDDLEKVKKIDGVKNAERKLSLLANISEEKTLQINFIESNQISKFYIVDGEEFKSDVDGIWLDNFYAKENKLKVGDKIELKYNGYTFKKEIKGLINVPDHVYDVKDESELFPNHENYGFSYISSKYIPEEIITKNVITEMNIDLETLNQMLPDYNYKDYIVYNYLMVDLNNEGDIDEIKEKIENEINPLAVIDIKDTPSYSTYQGEIDEGETYVGVFSCLFLFIAILSVITTMTRVVKKQRIQIGTLKALGFRKSKIAKHYIGYGFYVSLLASIAALIAGPLLIGRFFIGMEMKYFEVPNGRAVVDLSSFLIAIIVVMIISLVTYFTTKSVLKEKPAETLRVKMPNVKNKSLSITSKGIFKKMKLESKWNLRDILRNKARTFMGIAGISGCTMILVCAFGLLDTMNNFISWQFEDLYNFKYKLTLKENITEDQYNKLISEYSDNTSYTIGIETKIDKIEANTIFVTDANDYVRFTDKNGKYIKLKDDGIYITEKMAKNENLKIGDTIKWHVYGDKKYYETKIVGLDRNPQNQNIKMTKKYLEKIGIEYKPDTIYTNKDLTHVKEIDGVELIQNKDNIKDGMNNMLNTMKSMIILLISIAAILGAVIIYNLGILSFTEKQYQFATLKVLGFKDKQIKKIYVKQNNWITIVAIIIGLPFGYFMTDFIFKMALEENYDMQAYIKIFSYIYAIIGTLVVSVISSHILSKKVNKIDMVSSLKSNE